VSLTFACAAIAAEGFCASFDATIVSARTSATFSGGVVAGLTSGTGKIGAAVFGIAQSCDHRADFVGGTIAFSTICDTDVASGVTDLIGFAACTTPCILFLATELIVLIGLTGFVRSTITVYAT
jgi:hypothetical protein